MCTINRIYGERMKRLCDIVRVYFGYKLINSGQRNDIFFSVYNGVTPVFYNQYSCEIEFLNVCNLRMNLMTTIPTSEPRTDLDSLFHLCIASTDNWHVLIDTVQKTVYLLMKFFLLFILARNMLSRWKPTVQYENAIEIV